MRALAAAARNLRRAPAFSGLVVLTLALGIGATTAMFSVVDAVLINPLPFAKADRVVEVWINYEEDADRAPASASAMVAAIRAEDRLFEAVGAYQTASGILSDGGTPEVISTAGVSPSLASVFPAAPIAGRLFTAGDATSGERLLLISERMWTSRFGRDATVIDRVLTIDDVPHRVVGVLPDRFNFPMTGTDVWRPIDVETGDTRMRVNITVILRDGVTTTQVEDRLKTLTASLQASGALPKGQYLVTEVPWPVQYGRRGATALYLLLGAVSVLLLVACVNISNLMLVRASARRGEIALMAALGAGRSRLVRDAAVESLLLAVAGGTAGLWIAAALLRAILGLAPSSMFFLESATGDLDPRAIAFAVAVTAATCLAFSVVPAWRTSRLDPIDALRSQTRSLTGGRDEWLQGALVSIQIALVVVLLAGAGLLLRSYVALNGVDLGFDPDGLAVIDVQMPPRYGKGGTSRAFMREVERRVEAELGAPASLSGSPLRFQIEDDALPEVEGMAPSSRVAEPWSFARVSGDFFAVAGIPIVEGRAFSADDREDVIIVSEVFARRYFGPGSPIGRRFRSDPRLPWRTVIGVARDIKARGPADVAGEGAEMYLPMVPGDSRFLSLMVRTGPNEAAVIERVRQVIWALDPGMPIIAASTVRQIAGEMVSRPRFLASLSSAFTICALVIAAVGVYGVSAFWVMRRRRELAIRLAVGASPDRLIATVLGRGLRLAAIGTAIGLAVALAGARIMTSLLFAIDPRDPATFAGVTVLLGAIAILACLVPALKAARVDPMTTLRAE